MFSRISVNKYFSLNHYLFMKRTMGLQSSKVVSEPFGLFNDDEKEEMSKLYSKLSYTNNNKHFTAANLKELLLPVFPETFAQGLYQQMLLRNPQKNQTGVDSAGFGLFLVAILKGGYEEKASVLFRLMTTDDDEPTCRKLFDLVKMLSDVYAKYLVQTPEFRSWENMLMLRDNNSFVHFLLRDLFYTEKDERDFPKDIIPDKGFTLPEFEKWLYHTPIVLHIIDVAFHQCFPLKSTISTCIPSYMTGKKKRTTIMDTMTLLVLSSHLPVDIQKKPWRQLFNTAVDGESFSILVNLVLNKGPTVLVVRDDEGFTFGCFSSESWELNSAFRGSSECFVFSVSPILKVYPSTTFNDHFTYLNQNQQTLPNGMGIGGQFGYFGIWIDADFGKGSCSPTCTTYNCPQLSSRPEFVIRNLEVWGVGEKPAEIMTADGSILDHDLEVKAMLEMIGRGPVSDGLRDDDPTVQCPEEKESHLQQFE